MLRCSHLMGSNLCMGGTRRCGWVCNQAQGGTLSPRIPLARGCIMTDIAELFYRKDLYNEKRYKGVRLRAESSRPGSEIHLSGSGLDLNPLSPCWDNEESLDVNDITKLIATCQADLLITNKLHLLALHTADSSALPPHLLPSNHAVHQMHDFVLERTCDDADARDRYDAVLFCGGFQSVMEPKEALKKVLQKLKPGGNIIIFAKYTAWVAPPEDRTVVPYPASLRQLLFSAGFCDIKEVDVSGGGTSHEGMLCAVVGSRPGTAQGLQAALAAESTGYSSRSAIVLTDMVNRESGALANKMRNAWLNAYSAMREEAMLMGIPSSAVPELSKDASLEELQLARERLSGMIASFLSSGL